MTNIYQYRQINKFLNEKQLNKIGKKGWELVGIAVDSSANAIEYLYIFKRAYQENLDLYDIDDIIYEERKTMEDVEDVIKKKEIKPNAVWE